MRKQYRGSNLQLPSLPCTLNIPQTRVICMWGCRHVALLVLYGGRAKLASPCTACSKPGPMQGQADRLPPAQTLQKVGRGVEQWDNASSPQTCSRLGCSWSQEGCGEGSSSSNPPWEEISCREMLPPPKPSPDRHLPSLEKALEKLLPASPRCQRSEAKMYTCSFL